MKRMNWALRTVPCAVALLLTACAARGPEQSRPAVVLPAQFAGATTDAAAAIPAQWWTLFGDAELNRLVDAALAHNSDIAQAVARVELADAQQREVSGALLPGVDLGANAARTRSSGLTTSARSPSGALGNNFRLAASTSFELDFWGKLRGADRAARAGAYASRYARDTVRLTVAGLTVQSWIALRAIDEQLRLTRETLKTRDESLRVLGVRLKGGSGSGLEVEQARLLRADAALQSIELERQRALAQSQLALLTGEPGLSVVASGDAALPPAPVPPAGLPSSLLERRPDIQRAEQALVAAEANVAVARAAMYPTLSLTGLLGGESMELSTLLNAPGRIWSLAFGLSLPIFDGGRTAARTDQAKARQQEAVAAYQGAVGSAFKEAADAIGNLQAAGLSEPDLRVRAEASARAAKLAQMRFEAGYTGYLDVLDAQRSVNAAALDQVRNRQARLNYTVDLFKALGGGWAADAAR
jgi:multidrug efflux system outer membrane protein